MAPASGTSWQPHQSLTQAPTNLKEAIDWVLRVTGKDGKKNEAAKPQLGCLCYLAKAVKDLLYDARFPESPGPTPERNWDDLLLTEERTIVHLVLTDLGLLSDGSTSAASSTCAGGTEVIRTLIDQLAQGLQKWVGWQDQGDDCCLKGAGGGVSEGIGGKCTCPIGGGGVSGCCTGAGSTCNCASGTNQCGYKSSYDKQNALWTNIVNGTTGSTTTTTNDPSKVHLLARIFLGSVCLIWSGLSQLGFLTGGGNRWRESKLHEESANLGSFMAAMGYDLERLNGSPPGSGKKGEFVHGLLTGTDPKGDKGIQWQEFTKGASQSSVAEYYSEIYKKAQEALKKDNKTESICKDYPLLVLHILASGYFRAGSAGTNKITPAKPAPSAATKETPSSRKPRTIREILYWLSALPYSKGYCQLVERMEGKTDQVTNGNGEDKKGQIELYNESNASKASTTLHKDKMTHYLLAACGYCPLVLIGIQGTIEREVKQEATAGSGGSGTAGADKRCPEHKKDPSAKRCTLEDANKAAEAAKASAGSDGKLKEGEVCYGGYHLAVKDFGPLHGMYANGLFGFQMDISPAQCLDQLRIYVYHCFYQLYFLRKQCSAPKDAIAVGGAGGAKTVLGWQSCRYGSGLRGAGSENWICQGNSNGKCNCHSSSQSPLMLFLCDSVTGLHCRETIGSGVNDYPPIETHWTTKEDNPPGHFGTKELDYPKLCPVPMGWSAESPTSSTSGGQVRVNHFKDLNSGSHKQESLQTTGSTAQKYPAHCTGNTLSHLLEYYCDPEKCHGSLVLVLRLLACITPTVPRTLGDLFGFYYYIVYIGGNSASGGGKAVYQKLKGLETEVLLHMGKGNEVVSALTTWSTGGDCSGGTSGCKDTLRCLYGDKTGKQCTPFLCPLSGQQYGQLSPLMAGTYLSWLVYLIGEFQGGLQSLEKAFKDIQCKEDCRTGGSGGAGCGDGKCQAGTHGDPCSSGSANQGVCGCTSVVSCTGVLPVLYKYGFGYGNVTELHSTKGLKKCHEFLRTLESVLQGDHLRKDGKGLHHEINQLIYTTRLPWIFVLTIAWLMAVLYLAFGAIWPLDWTHMRSHCRGWFRKGSLSPWEILMVGKKKGRGILEFFGGR